MSADDRPRPDLERMYRMRSSTTSGSGGGGGSRNRASLQFPFWFFGAAFGAAQLIELIA
ncbi:MAG: hypothetical protein ACRD0W_19190 [Acidimicrobiales bacterium]